MFSKNAIDTLNASDFLSRFLGFIERYSEFTDNVSLASAVFWANQHNYDYIRYFLSTNTVEDKLPFSLSEFSYMSESEIVAWHDYCIEWRALLNEKDFLYQELNGFYY